MATTTAEITLRLRDQVTKAYKRVKNEVERNNASIRGSLKQTADKTKQSFGKLGSGIKSAGAGMKDFFKRFGPAAAVTAVLTIAIVKLGQAIQFVNRVSIEFEKTMSQVRAIVRPSAGEFAALTEEAKRLGGATVFSASEAGQAFVELGKLGFTTEQILASTGDVLNIAAASMTELGRAAEVTAGTVKQFGLDVSDSKRVTDVMAESFSSSALDMERFAESMKFAGVQAANTGVSLETTTAALGILADRQISGSQAGTALRRVLLELGNANGKAAKLIGRADFATLSFTEKLKLLQDKNLSPDKIQKTFGLLASTAATVLIKAPEQVEALTGKLNEAEDAAKNMSDTMLDNVAGAQKILEANSEALGIALGEAFGESKRKRIEFYQKVMQKATEFVKDHKEEISAVAHVFSTVFVGAIKLVIKMFRMLLTIINLVEAGFFIFLEKITRGVRLVLIGINKIRSAFGKDAIDTSSIDNAIDNLVDKSDQIAARTINMFAPVQKSAERAKVAVGGLAKAAEEIGFGDATGDDGPAEKAKKLKGPMFGPTKLPAEVEEARKLQKSLQTEAFNGRTTELEQLKNFEDKKRAILVNAGMDTIALEQVVQKRRESILKASADAETARRREGLAATVSNLETIAGKWKQFGPIFKASAIAQATIDTYKGATAAYSSLAGIPVVGPALGGAAAAAAVVAGFVNIAKIKAQKFATGGVVKGPSAGDQVPILANGGERILTARQNRNFENMMAGGGSRISFEAPIINIENGDPDTIRRAVGETYQEMLNKFALTQRDAQLNEVVA
jgi:TP901 family phage tail tape measure protein